MAFQSKGSAERIIGMGGPGAGKTRVWLTIAEMMRKTHSENHMYVIDTDRAADRMLEGFPDLKDWPNLHVHEVYEFGQYLETSDKLRKQVGKGDWMVADLFSTAWDEAQAYYTNEVIGKSRADYFLMKRKEMSESAKNFQPFEGWTDWTVIKPLYAEFANNVLFKHPGHVYLTTGLKAVDRKQDSKDTVQAFGHIGYRPEGEKRAGHAVHTVLMLSQRKPGEWIMDTAKDRERTVQMSTPVSNFAIDYLVKVAGWSMK